jgi:hypothetical protein
MTLRWREPDSNYRFRITRPRFQDRLMSPLPDSPPTEIRANESRHREDAGRLPRNRWFEACSLQRRVCCEPLHGATSAHSRAVTGDHSASCCWVRPSMMRRSRIRPATWSSIATVDRPLFAFAMLHLYTAPRPADRRSIPIRQRDEGWLKIRIFSLAFYLDHHDASATQVTGRRADRTVTGPPPWQESGCYQRLLLAARVASS